MVAEGTAGEEAGEEVAVRGSGGGGELQVRVRRGGKRGVSIKKHERLAKPTTFRSAE